VIRIEEVPGGVAISVRAQPGARKNAIVGEHDGALKIAVTAPPDKGKANEAIVSVLAAALDLPKSSVELMNGHTSRQKKFLLKGATASAVEGIVKRLVTN
jgi:uncharacterized protein